MFLNFFVGLVRVKRGLGHKGKKTTEPQQHPRENLKNLNTTELCEKENKAMVRNKDGKKECYKWEAGTYLLIPKIVKKSALQ